MTTFISCRFLVWIIIFSISGWFSIQHQIYNLHSLASHYVCVCVTENNNAIYMLRFVLHFVEMIETLITPLKVDIGGYVANSGHGAELKKIVFFFLQIYKFIFIWLGYECVLLLMFRDQKFVQLLRVEKQSNREMNFLNIIIPWLIYFICGVV